MKQEKSYTWISNSSFVSYATISLFRKLAKIGSFLYDAIGLTVSLYSNLIAGIFSLDLSGELFTNFSTPTSHF